MVYSMSYYELTEKKKQLDALRSKSTKAPLQSLEEWFQIELTYTSNAIEGNTLTRHETALVVEDGLTVGGKTLVEHLEARNHVQALQWVKTQQDRAIWSLQETDILRLHGFILKGIDDENAGRYRNVPVRISGSAVVLPNAAKLPILMQGFIHWIHTSQHLHPVERALEAHYRLVTIHPFVDGNGRTARLLMNMMLLMDGYVPAIVRKQDRLKYLTALEEGQLGGSKEPYMKLMAKCVDRSLDIYLKHLKEETPQFLEEKLLKIGEIARQSEETQSTLRYWTKQGLLSVADVTKSGYQLYAPSALKRIEKIRQLKQERLSLEEIQKKLSSMD